MADEGGATGADGDGPGVECDTAGIEAEESAEYGGGATSMSLIELFLLGGLFGFWDPLNLPQFISVWTIPFTVTKSFWQYLPSVQNVLWS